MEPTGWTMLNSVAAFGPESFAPTGQERWLFAWRVNDLQDVQMWLEEDSGCDGTLYDAELIDASGFISRAERLFALPMKSVLPDLSWIRQGWIVYEAEEEVSMVGEGFDRLIIIYYSLGCYIIQ